MPEHQGAPDSRAVTPVAAFPQIGFLKNIIRSPLITAGDFSYYDDPAGPEHFEEKCVLYHYDFIGDRLEIGRYCALAQGVTFIMNGANHAMQGFSTYPFGIFPGAWRDGLTPRVMPAAIVAIRRLETMSGSAPRRRSCRV